MGNINVIGVEEELAVVALSTPYGKHKQAFVRGHLRNISAFYSLWET